MAVTQRFGLSMFGGRIGGSIADGGSKFSIRDRQILDALLGKLFAHTHTGADALADPVGGPVIALGVDPAGQIPAGVEVYYRVSYVDPFGLETAASEEYVISTAPPTLNPTAPAATVETGGTLTTGSYEYSVTFYQNTGGETTYSPSAVAAVNSLTALRQVRLDLPTIPDDADGWRIYRRDPGSAGFYRLASQARATGTEYLDDGSVAADTNFEAPVSNTTNSANVVNISPPGGTLPAGVSAWRIYRSYTSGVYSDQSLVHEVVERVDEFDPNSALLTTYADLGTQTFDGIPLDVSHTAGDGPAISGGGGGGSSSFGTRRADQSGDIQVADGVFANVPLTAGTVSGADVSSLNADGVHVDITADGVYEVTWTVNRTSAAGEASVYFIFETGDFMAYPFHQDIGSWRHRSFSRTVRLKAGEQIRLLVGSVGVTSTFSGCRIEISRVSL